MSESAGIETRARSAWYAASNARTTAAHARTVTFTSTKRRGTSTQSHAAVAAVKQRARRARRSARRDPRHRLEHGDPRISILAVGLRGAAPHEVEIAPAAGEPRGRDPQIDGIGAALVGDHRGEQRAVEGDVQPRPRLEPAGR